MKISSLVLQSVKECERCSNILMSFLILEHDWVCCLPTVAPSIVTPPEDVEVMVAELVMFQCSVFGVPEPTITWLG